MRGSVVTEGSSCAEREGDTSCVEGMGRRYVVLFPAATQEAIGNAEFGSSAIHDGGS